MKKQQSKYYFLFTILLLPVGWWFWLPDPLFDASYSTVLLDLNDQLLGARLAADGQWRFPGDELVVPKTFEKAIIEFEDKRFYNHGGIDFIALMRAVKDNVMKRDVVSGGSTLTMQTMRMARGKKARSIWQKGIEMMWAWRAEIRYSKREIMQIYASHAPFGGNVVGLGAASWRYFHKTPDQLSWGEAATLAVLPNAPGLIHPGRNRDALLKKRNILIQDLVAKGIIDETEASLAMLEPLPNDPHPLPDHAPHLLSKYSKSGTILHSTIDLELQQRLTELLQRHADILSLNGVNNAALMVMETESGAVRAYIGNAYDTQKDHQNDVDIITSERSSGSILKPFLYCAALEEGLITPKGILEDIPTYIRGYQPLNYTEEYSGMVPADQSLAMSLNVPAVRLLQQYGILPFKEKLVKGGITTLHYTPEHYGLPLVLGGAEVTLWDVCGAYASMGRVLDHAIPYDYKYDRQDIHSPVILRDLGGIAERRNGDKSLRLTHSDRRSLRLTLSDQHDTYQSSRYSDRNYSDQAPVWTAAGIWQTFEAMSTLRRPDQEGQWETFHSSRRIAWKTGTSFGYRDAWAVGLTPSYTIGVWVGNADGEGRPGVIGLHAAAPILFDVLRMLDDDGSWWEVPFRELTQKLVCRESGWLAGSLCTQIDTALIIKGDHVPQVCSYHTTCFTDANTRYRYNPGCSSSETMLTNYFVVPTEAETYYKRYNPSYQTMPPLHPSCVTDHSSRNDIAIIYPRSGSKIYVPYEWDHKKSKAVFSAVHRSDTANVYWHLDKEYLGKTKEFHTIEIDPKPGVHHLVLQDEWGSVVETRFEVLEGN